MGTGCLACPVGTFTDWYGSDECAVCGPGKVSVEVGGTACNYCSGNTINTDGLDGAGGMAEKHDGYEDCESCPGGGSANDAHTLCEMCGAGKETNPDGTGCNNCEAGRFSDGQRFKECWACVVSQM